VHKIICLRHSDLSARYDRNAQGVFPLDNSKVTGTHCELSPHSRLGANVLHVLRALSKCLDDTVHLLPAAPDCAQLQDSPLPELPKELLARVLRHVEQFERLAVCTYVCKAWRAAAVAASSDVRVASNSRHFSALSLGRFRQWLRKHAAAVAQLEVDSTCQADVGWWPGQLASACSWRYSTGDFCMCSSRW
jgi:hypothetical protein